MQETQPEALAGTAQPGTTADVRAPVLVAIAGPAKQHRLTVAFRLILAIPHAVVLGFIGIAAFVAAVIGWFGALFTGRLPTFAADLLSGYLRWQIRYVCYLYLLTGVYPPFSLDEDGGYPVQLAVRPGRLNRLAVLFRLLLAIPASIVVGVAGYGLQVVMVVAWLIALVRGTLPAALHQAIAAVLRYQIRLAGYGYMLTAEYPWGLYGDHPGGQEPASVAPSVPAAVQGWEQPEPGAAQPWVGYGTTQPMAGEAPAGTEPGSVPGEAGSAPQEAGTGFGEAALGLGAQEAVSAPAEAGSVPGEAVSAPAEAGPGFGVQEAAPGHGGDASPDEAETSATGPAAPISQVPVTSPAAGAVAAGELSWRMVLSSAARRLVTLFIVVGVLVVAAFAALAFISVGATVSRPEAIREVRSAHAKLISATEAFASRAAVCRSSSNPLPCVTSADRTVAKAFGSFGQSIGAIGMPSGASTVAAAQVASAASRVQRALQQLGQATSVGEYEQRIQSTNLQQILAELDRDYQELGSALNASL